MTEKERLLLQMYSSQKRKKIVIFSIVIVVMLALIASAFYFVITSQSFHLKKETITIEYGQKYIPDVKDFIDDTDISKVISFDCDIPNETAKDYVAVGDYKADIKTETPIVVFGKSVFTLKSTSEASIVVKDTTPPKFNTAPEVIDLYVNANENKPDLSKYFTATDLSGDCTISISDADVDYKTANKYNIKVTAMDKYENSKTTDCLVNIINPTLSISQTSIDMFVGDTKTLDIEYKGSDELIFKSSNGDIASVNSSGKIVAKAKGNCIITTSAGDIQVNCSVYISEKVEVPTTKESTTKKKVKQEQTATKKQTPTPKLSKKKYPNKDFLFTDGYTMDNVTDAAYSYLKKSGQSGSCVPLKNSEGIYIGMRVVFD